MKEDKLYLAKMFCANVDAIEKNQAVLDSSSKWLESIVEGLDVNDGRSYEMLMHLSNTKMLLQYAQFHGISHGELLTLIEEYKALSIEDYFAIKEKVTIENELEILLKQAL